MSERPTEELLANHDQLCALAVKWLQRPQGRNGHDCSVAFTEVRSGWDGEMPDAIGFRRKGDGDDGSVVVEVKVSRADFLADAKKPHRHGGGLGTWRYFMCPEGLISADELPERWGLLWVTHRGHIKPQAGPAATMSETKNLISVDNALAAFRQDSDQDRELFIVVRMLARVGDPAAVNDKLRKTWADRQRLARKCDQQRDRIKALQIRVLDERYRAAVAIKEAESAATTEKKAQSSTPLSCNGAAKGQTGDQP